MSVPFNNALPTRSHSPAHTTAKRSPCSDLSGSDIELYAEAQGHSATDQHDPPADITNNAGLAQRPTNARGWLKTFTNSHGNYDWLNQFSKQNQPIIICQTGRGPDDFGGYSYDDFLELSDEETHALILDILSCSNPLDSNKWPKSAIFLDNTRKCLTIKR